MADYAITNVARRVVYTGSAGVGPYAFSFPVLVNTDIAVYKNTTLLTLTTDYTVTISGTTGQGSITLVVAATGADRITIVGARSIERSTDFVTGGDFFANTLNTELDSEVIFVQQIAETAERSIKAPVTDPTSINMTLPANTTRANKFLSFNSTGNPQTVDSLGAYKGNWATSTAYNLQDIVKDTSNSNIYICITAHTSTGSQPISSNADVAKWSLMVDAAAAGTSATAAAASASAASTSATNAASSASAASTSASNASTSASTASTQASNASTSATNAASSASSASGSASTATTQASNASTSATAAASSATAAASSATSASGSASTATTQASNAATSASNASTSATSASGFATSASTQASNAATSASNASTSASNASTSATNAATSATNAAASYDAFDDRYLGSKSSAPSVDNDGNALLTGALYYNTTASQLYVWNGSAWDAAAFSVSGAVTSFSAGSTGFTPNTATTGAVTLGGTLDVDNGGTGTSTAFTSGSVVFAGASGTYTQDNANFFWDDTNNRLGIGITSPQYKLDAFGSGQFRATTNTTSNAAWYSIGSIQEASAFGVATGIVVEDSATNKYAMTFGTKPNSATAITERMRIDSAGNVGIGTASAATKLQVEFSSAGTTIAGSPVFTLKNTSFTNNCVTGVVAQNSAGGNAAGIDFINVNQVADGGGASGSIGLWTNNSGTKGYRIYADNSGNVGIGTTSPTGKLCVGTASSGNAANALVQMNATTPTIASGTGMLAIGSTDSAAVDKGGVLSFHTNTTSLSGFPAGFIAGKYQTAGAGVYSGYLQFATSDAAGTVAERMRIDSSGNVGIGTTPISSTTSILQLNGDINLKATVATIMGNVYYASGWKYNGNGSGGYIKFAATSTVAVTIGYATNNTSGAGAAATANDNGIVLDTSGNVGIGTTSPTQKLEVNGAINITSGTERLYFDSVSSSSSYSGYVGRNSSTGSLEIAAQNIGSNYPITLLTANTERMRIHASGGVSIGNTTDSGAASLNVNGSMSGGYIAHANGTTAIAFGADNVARVTPTATATYTSTVPAAGAICVLSILTSGTSSYTITFGTGFKSTGTLATGTVSARYFNITFVSDGTNLIEMSRTTAIT